MITSVHPNPIEEKITVTLNCAQAGTVHFKLLNNAGETVRQWSTWLTGGTNTIPFSAGSLSKGIYYLQVSGLNGYHLYTLVK
jgi:hypothetical protein